MALFSLSLNTSVWLGNMDEYTSLYQHEPSIHRGLTYLVILCNSERVFSLQKMSVYVLIVSCTNSEVICLYTYIFSNTLSV